MELTGVAVRSRTLTLRHPPLTQHQAVLHFDGHLNVFGSSCRSRYHCIAGQLQLQWI